MQRGCGLLFDIVSWRWHPRLDIPVTRAGHTRLKARREISRWEIWESLAQGQRLEPGVRGSQGGRVSSERAGQK